MPPTVAEKLSGVELRQAKSQIRKKPVALQEVSSVPGELVRAAFDLAHLDREQAAAMMGVSGSLLARQLQNVDNQHLSLQRLWNLSDPFWREFVLLILRARRLGRVRREIRIAL
jgi:hypothetical protein